MPQPSPQWNCAAAVMLMGLCFMDLQQLLCCCVSPVSSHTNTLQYQGTGITFSIGYPPDTATPGYEEENKTKVCGVFHVSFLPV